MNDPVNLSVTVIGTGALGSALIDFFRKQNIKIRSTWNSRGGTVFQDSGEEKGMEYSVPKSEAETGSLIFITTPDDLILEVSVELSTKNIKWHKKKVVHCSGNLNSVELSSLSKKNAKTASMHPIQTFKKGDGTEKFRDITISLEGDPLLVEELKNIVEAMGGRYLELTKDQKRAVHVAAVFASNYFVALLHAAESHLKDAGIEHGIEILEPLISQTVENSIEISAADALTGPVSRGDLSSIRKHLKALKSDKELLRLYKLLGSKTVQIAQEQGKLPDEVLRQMTKLFTA